MFHLAAVGIAFFIGGAIGYAICLRLWIVSDRYHAAAAIMQSAAQSKMRGNPRP